MEIPYRKISWAQVRFLGGRHRARRFAGLDKLSRKGTVIAEDGAASPGRHCHSTLPLAVVDCHSLGTYMIYSCWHCCHFLSK